MAKKKTTAPEIETEGTKHTEDYYRLKTKAVDDLVTADESNSPEVSEAELRKYKRTGKIKIPHWVKVVLLKIWFAGAVCFFILWGLGTYVTAFLDMLFILGIALGVVNDILVNNILRYFEETPGSNDRWMMFPKKKFATFFFNIIYSFVILFCVYTLYNVINLAIVNATGAQDTVPLGVEPLLFGTFYMAFDMLFIFMKRTFASIVSDAKKSVRR